MRHNYHHERVPHAEQYDPHEPEDGLATLLERQQENERQRQARQRVKTPPRKMRQYK